MVGFSNAINIKKEIIKRNDYNKYITILEVQTC